MSPSFAFVEMYIDGTVFLGPSVLFRPVEHRWFGLSDVSCWAAWAWVFIDYHRIAKKRNLILVRSEEGDLWWLEENIDLYLFFESPGEFLLCSFDYLFRFLSDIWEREKNWRDIVFIWISSFCLSSSVVTSSFILCSNVLIIPIFCFMWWFDLKSRYWSVCVAFL